MPSTLNRSAWRLYITFLHIGIFMNTISTISIAPAPFESVRCIRGFDLIRSEYPSYLSDESRLSANPFEYLFFPADEAELAAVLEEMTRRRTPVTISGARTGLVGGAISTGGALVSLEKLNRISNFKRDSNSDEWRLTAQCAVTLTDIEQFVSEGQSSIPCPSDLSENLAKFQNDPNDYFYPPDPTEKSASIGGMVATNASGARTFRYGPTRNWVRRLRVMLITGEILDISRGTFLASPEGSFNIKDVSGRLITVRLPDYRMPDTKNTAGFYAAPGMDLIDLFIGSEGVLGAVTEVEIALAVRKSPLGVVQFLPSDEQALHLVEALRRENRLALESIEFYSTNALELIRREGQSALKEAPEIPESAGSAIFFELAVDPSDMEAEYQRLSEIVSGAGADMENSWAATENKAIARFRAFRHLLPETVNRLIGERKKAVPGLHKLGTDLAVPQNRLKDMWHIYRDELEKSGLQWVAFGHIGNAHIHVNILPRDMADLEKGRQLYTRFARSAVEFGGTISAEHGVGKLKSDLFKLMFTNEQIEAMKTVKRALDPRKLLNPGNIFDME